MRYTIISTAILIGVCSQLLGQSKSEKINELMTAYNKLGQFNGTVLVAEHGNIIYKKSFGLADMQWGIQNASDTKFLLASVSKQFTAMLILQLVDMRLVNLSGKISDYLPYYNKQLGSRISIHHLLTHTSGIPDVTNLPDFDTKYAHQHFSVKELTHLFDSLSLDFEPGTQYQYSNSGYSVLAAIIEEVTHKSYAEVLKEQICRPLKMNSTSYSKTKTVMEKQARGYRAAPIEGYINDGYFDNSISIGAGGIYSTIDDLWLWDQALYRNKLLSDSLKVKMFTPFKNSYGYGFNIRKWGVPETKDSLTFIEHGGAIGGFNTLIFRSINDKNLVVLLTNTNEAKLNFIKNRIRSILYNRPYDLPEREMKSIVGEALRNKGINEAKIIYTKLLKEKGNDYGLSEFEYEFSQLGYSLVLSDHLDEAIEIYSLNIGAFPKSSKAFEDLGEAYLIKGDKELAAKYYSQSFDLDSENLRAKKMLEKLRE